MRSKVLQRKAAPRGGIGKQEKNRRLTSLGLSRHDPDEIVNKALAIVERFRQWTDRQPCCITGFRTGQVVEFEGQTYRVFVQWCHVLGTRGAWNADFGITLPLFDVLHKVQERTADFFESRGLNAEAMARAHALKFFTTHPSDAQWMIAHAQDGDVIALATAGLEAT